jgi:UDP-glucose 4-epimerase
MNILITGENGYVGKSFYNWVKKSKRKINIDFVSIRNEKFKEIEFSKYSVIIHLAGLVHKKKGDFKYSDYIKVNFNKTKELVDKAIECKVNLFIYMSSMAVFSKSEIINKSTPLIPNTNYGISKKLAEDFIISKKKLINVAILRPPMIFGFNAPGNAIIIENISRRISFFPNIKNKRSFVEIDYLCEVIFDIIEKNKSGIFHPSSPIMSTYDLFKYYRGKKKSYELNLFNPIIKLFLKFPKLNKIFGNLYYESGFDHVEFK